MENAPKLHAITPPLDNSVVSQLKAGDRVSISGTIYTARDSAHRRFRELLLRDKPLPIDLAGQILYYTGPSPAKPGSVIGSAGPTTAGRMDSITPLLLERTGLKVTMGKGNRSPEVIDAMKRCGAAYFVATGGAGALLSHHVVAARIACYEDLGPEAVYELTVKDFPATVAVDCTGEDLFKTGPAHMREILRNK